MAAYESLSQNGLSIFKIIVAEMIMQGPEIDNSLK
jgi:hypothetical protein